jgi:hypothetical protein
VRGLHLIDFRHDDSVARLREHLGIDRHDPAPSEELAS